MRQIPRRAFLKCAGVVPLVSASYGRAEGSEQMPNEGVTMPNMLGAYGRWAAESMQDPPRLSFRQPMFTDSGAWRPIARSQFREKLMQPGGASTPVAAVLRQFEFDGLSIEHLQWQLPFGPPTEALFLKPAGSKGKLPGIVGLHDHGGQKYFGMRKITRVSNDQHPVMQRHQDQYYGGAAWANELARRGYGVLVHDTFTFGSRRIRLGDVPANIRNNLVEVNPDSEEEIERYNQFAANHEHVIAKSLFCAGLTWPGVFVFDDQRALDYLASRPDVDATRIGCAGLSGGGLRTVMLTGADERIRCSCCVGDDDNLARLSAQQVLHPHLDGLCAGPTAGSRVCRSAGDIRSKSGTGVEQSPGLAVHDDGDATGRRDTDERLQEGRRAGALPSKLLRRAAQV
jgi:dienelactone hydrolase